MKKFRPFVALAALSAAVLGLTGCAPQAEETAAEGYGDLTVQFSWIKNAEFAGEYFADSNGYYSEAGFSSVNFIAGPTATAAVVLSGDALVGISDAVAVAPVILEEGAPLKIIGATYQKNPFTILSLKDGANIQSPQDLIGKRIGVQAGGNETLFDALLKVNGIDPSQVTKVPVEYDPAPLVNGEVDGFLAYVTNESITVQNLGYEVTNLLFADAGLPFVAEAFVVTQDNIDNNREALKAFLKATIRGWRDAIANPDEGARLAVEVYGKDLGLDINKEKQQAKAQNELLVVTEETKVNGLLTVSEQLQALNIATLKAAGYDITAEQLFDMSLLAEVYAENPDLLG
ncbi:MAG: ABC transporter substrate-binding protein [Actinobacteria bacterium]|nr:ABC transporter substrate-binding protein [Actinomycetota bacterium]